MRYFDAANVKLAFPGRGAYRYFSYINGIVCIFSSGNEVTVKPHIKSFGQGVKLYFDRMPLV
ncbi:hypothetical protein D3C73_1593200 [compost metagenome]